MTVITTLQLILFSLSPSLPLSLGKTTIMGPLLVSMPRSNYQGTFSASNESASSKLIGAINEDEEMMARQMSARLSRRLNRSVFVSCSLSGAPSMAVEGTDLLSVQHRAAALVERHVYQAVSQRSIQS